MELDEFFRMQSEREQKKRLESYRRLNRFARKGQIVFAGSSLMEYFPVNEMAQSLGISCCIYNRGIGGYVSGQMLDAIETQILDLEPKKLFINIGTNDIGRGEEETLWKNYETILGRVRAALPECRIYVMAYYPCNNRDDFGLPPQARAGMFAHRTPESLREANQKVRSLAEKMGCRYIDVNDGLTDETGLLKAEYCIDGVHFYPDGYLPVLENLRPWLEE